MSLVKRALLLAKVEAAYGVDPTPTPALNAILHNNILYKAPGELITRNFQRASLSPLPHAVGLKEVEVTFETELKGSGTADGGTAGDEPEIDPLLQACGFAVTLNAAVSVVYDPASDGLKSVTLYVYADGLLHKILGCVGSVSANMVVGQIPTLQWTFKGLYQAPTDVAIPGGAVFNAEIGVPFLNAAFTTDAYAAIVQALTWDMANEIARRDSINEVEGVKGFLISGRDTQGSFNPEAVDEATHPFWGDWKSGVQHALTATVGSVAGALIDITAPKAQYREVNYGNRSAVRVYDIPMTLPQDAGDDEIQLKFY